MVSWEYRTDGMAFKAFDPKQSVDLEKAFAENAETFPMAIGSQKYSIDLKLLVQRNVKTGKERLIRRVGPDGEVTSRVAVWEWNTGKEWSQYSIPQSQEIERAFSASALKTVIKVATSAHDTVDVTIHFGHMTQSTAKNPDKQRPVRRVMKTLSTPSIPATQEDKPTAKAEETPKGARAAKRPRDDTEPAGDTTTTASAAPLATAKTWTVHESVLLLPAHGEMPPSRMAIKVAAFDMDDTLVKAKGGRVFAKARDDWEWLCSAVPSKLKQLHEDGYKIVIISNQAGIGSDDGKASSVQGKVLDLSAALKIPLSAALATEKDGFRKPEVALWKLVVSRIFSDARIDYENSFYCGDAAGRKITTLAGRKKDFSCTDRKFAYNANLKFLTPEEFFEGRAPTKDFDWEVGPADLADLPKSYPRDAYHSKTPELVVMVGFPGCGKSTFCNRFFVPHGYIRVNRDTLKTKEKCIAAAKSSLAAGSSVCVDNTNPLKEDRKVYIDLAKALKVPARCFHHTATKAMAEHMNTVRHRTGGEHVPGIAYNTYQSKFQAPEVGEGFDEVIAVPPVADFTGLPEAVKTAFYQLSGKAS